MPEVSNFAENVRRLLEERNISLNAFARDADVDPATLSLLLRGRQTVRLDTAFKIAKTLQVSLDDLAATSQSA